MEPDLHYRPADHAASPDKTVAAWVICAVMLLGLGLPSLWARVTEAPAKAALTAEAPAPRDTTATRLCQSYERLMKAWTAKHPFG